MIPADAEALARNLMREHLHSTLCIRGGLFDTTTWGFGFNNRRTIAGCCSWKRARIELSKPWVLVNTEASVRSTILHEIAHAIAGPYEGHSHVWRKIAIRLGDDGERCTGLETVAPPALWVGTCAAGHTATAHRKPSPRRLLSSCGRCSRVYSPQHQYTWRRNDLR